MQGNNRFALPLGLVLVLVYAGCGLATEPLSLEIQPQTIEIGTFFSGCTVHLSGHILTDQDIVIEILGPDEKSKFSMKGRVGPFWMNREKVELENAPFLYRLLLPENQTLIERMLSRSVGIEHLKQRITMTPEYLNFDKVFDLFVQLKQSEKLYPERNGVIRYSAKKEGRKPFEAVFSFPAATAPGDYKIVATLIGEDGHTDPFIRGFEVKEVGLIKAIRMLAYYKSLLYGILSVLIALSVGALIGMAFKRSGGH